MIFRFSLGKHIYPDGSNTLQGGCFNMRRTKSNIILLVLLAINFVSGMYNIFLANALSDDILESAALGKEIERIEQENQLLYIETLALSSYEYISSRAAELGFIQASEYIVIGR